jgi:RNA polymerase sigma-70 factor (ECF subfamily)
MDDELLVREFQRTGDRAHFTALVERHRRSVFRLVLSLLGAGQEGAAEDLTQDVWLIVFRTAGQFRGEAKFSTWLYRIAYREAVRHRSRLRFRTPHDGEAVLAMMPSDGRRDNPFTASSDGHTASAVKACVAELPDLYRSILHQYYWLGMTVPEISDILAVPTGTVKSYLHRSRAKLQELLIRRGISNV